MPSLFSMKYKTFPLIIIVFIIFLFPVYSQAEPSQYGRKMAEKALNEKIYDERMWHVLMQYKKPGGRKLRSLVDDEKFFLAENGKYSPKDELEATILALFNDDLSKNDDNSHPVCVFAGRREWLVERLGIDRNKLPEKSCTKYNEFRKKLDPSSVTVIFPFMYLKNPASMFGHTMLRINNSSHDPLTSHSVTFAADMPEDANGFEYITLGLFGGYSGYFTVKQYYKTIFEYGNMENRDIWEYDLNLTKEETIKLFNHLWEMQGIGSDYYFFDENCSYNMLMLLESARPDLYLSTSILWEAPTDTIKKIKKSGLIDEKKYRPSHIKILEIYSKGLPNKAVTLAQDVAEGKKTIDDINNSSYSVEEKADIYDLAIEAMRFNFLQRSYLTEEIVREYQKNTIDILANRARLGVKSHKKIEEPGSPDEGHAITRIKIGVGAENFKEFYTEAGFKLGFHGLDDIDKGFIQNSQLDAIDVNVRWNTRTNEVTVPEAALLRYASYSPIKRMTKSLSWKIEIAGEEKDYKKGSFFTPYLRGGVGVTFAAGGFSSWIMADMDLAFSEGYNPYWTGLGFGGDIGLMYSFIGGKFLARGYYRYFVLENLGAEFGGNFTYTIPVTQNNSIEIKYGYKNHWEIENHDIGVFWRFYF